MSATTLALACWSCLLPLDHDDATWLDGVPLCEGCTFVETGDDHRTPDRERDR